MQSVQGLVYIFIGLAALALGAAAYFGLTFSPIEAFLAALMFCVLGVVGMERVLRQRAEARLEKAIEDLSRLLSTDAQAGAVLSQRLNSLAGDNAGRRLESVEADISVLGTVVRQVAEAVADIEEARRRGVPIPPSAFAAPMARPSAVPVEAQSPEPVLSAVVPEPEPEEEAFDMPLADMLPEPPPAPERAAAMLQSPPDEDSFPEPVIPLEMVEEAVEEGRLVIHLNPIMTLPQRRVHGYDMVPRLAMDDGDFANPPDFLPRQSGETLVARIELLALEEAVVIARRARTEGHALTLYVPLSRASLQTPAAMQALHAVLDANAAIAGQLAFTIAEREWREFRVAEFSGLTSLTTRGVTLSLADITTLRVDMALLAGEGVRSLRMDAPRFVATPGLFTDFHAGDVVSFARRHDIDLVATNIGTEQDILALLDDGFGLAQGRYLSEIGPARADLAAQQPARAPRRRAEPVRG